MKNTILSFLVFGFAIATAQISNAAIIEGHFYSSTCGENTLTSTLQFNNELTASNPATVKEVCHGQLLQNGDYVETIRLTSIEGDQAQSVDFKITEKTVMRPRHAGSSDLRGQVYEVFLSVVNDKVGTVQFWALYEGHTIISIKSLPPVSSSFNFAVTDMKIMMNISSFDLN